MPYPRKFVIDESPIIESLFDGIDYYKLTMLLYVLVYYIDVPVKWELINRKKEIRLADEIDIDSLKHHLAHAESLMPSSVEQGWLKGDLILKDYASPGILGSFLESFSLSKIDVCEESNGQYSVSTRGPWPDTMLWETLVMRIVSTLRTRAFLQFYSERERTRFWNDGEHHLREKLHSIRREKNRSGYEGEIIVDMATRRAACPEWHNNCLDIAFGEFPDLMIGTSNVGYAYAHGLEPKGTIAHEISMAHLAIFLKTFGVNPDTVARSQRDAIDKWSRLFGTLSPLVALPDTFTSEWFFEEIGKEQLQTFKAYRIDSGDMIERGLKYIELLALNGLVTGNKELIWSDGLNGVDIEKLLSAFTYRFGKLSFGWGTNFGNDLPGLPTPAPIVMKLTEVDGIKTVKLSDNVKKAMGPRELVSEIMEACSVKMPYSEDVKY